MSRLLICDPVCVFSYGHNVSAMRNFRDLVGKYFEESLCLGGKYLDKELSQKFQIEPFFDYYYDDVMPLPEAIRSGKLLQSHEEKLTAAKRDFDVMLNTYAVNGHDSICFPSVDFYSLYALVNGIEALHAVGRPRLLIRLIGVMETACSGYYGNSRLVMEALIARLVNSGLDVRLAAETPRYAEYLAVRFQTYVTVAANIEVLPFHPLKNDGLINVICPGSARYDKGFLQLYELFTRVRDLDPELRIRFTTQTLPDRELKSQLDYASKIYAIPGVELLPSVLESAELVSLYQNADLVLLPYANDVYQYRGSAVLVEALCTGRYCLSLNGAAFVDQMIFFGGGEACSSIAHMAERIKAFSCESFSVREAKARQARNRFMRDLLSSYDSWVN